MRLIEEGLYDVLTDLRGEVLVDLELLDFIADLALLAKESKDKFEDIYITPLSVQQDLLLDVMEEPAEYRVEGTLRKNYVRSLPSRSLMGLLRAVGQVLDRTRSARR